MPNVPCCIMENFYADIALLLPKGSFYAEKFCIEFPCASFVQKSKYISTSCLYIYIYIFFFLIYLFFIIVYARSKGYIK